VAERDAADENAARGWKAADELAEKVEAAQDAAAEADRRARTAEAAYAALANKRRDIRSRAWQLYRSVL
jgi:predicted amidophosphoribosyltransferase